MGGKILQGYEGLLSPWDGVKVKQGKRFATCSYLDSLQWEKKSKYFELGKDSEEQYWEELVHK